MFNQVIKGMSVKLDLIQEGITISEKELIQGEEVLLHVAYYF